MSNLVFPSLPGLSTSMTRREVMKVNVYEAQSGKRLRSTYWSYPSYHYSVDFDCLPTTIGYQSLQTLMNFFASHLGQLDSFLLQDPDDSSVTDHGFATGNGSTTVFQLQRSLKAQTSDALGTYTNGSKPRTNLASYSDPAQTINNTGTATRTNCGMAPDGSTNCTFVYDDLTTGDHSRSMSPVPAHTPGKTYTFSAFAKAGTLNFLRLRTNGVVNQATFDLSLGTVVSTTAGTATIAAVGNGWYRCALTFTPAVTTGFLIGIQQTDASNSYNGNGNGLFVWQLQVEEGSNATQPIATNGTALTVSPAYWPSYGDGFEPVFDPVWSSITITQEGDWRGKRTLYPWQRTNICLYSEQFDNAAWNKTFRPGTTVTANATTAPDGNSTADLVTYDGSDVAGQIRIYQHAGGTSVAGKTYVSSIWLKANTGATTIGLSSNIATADITLTTSWQRFSIVSVGNGAGQVGVMLKSGSTDNSAFSVYAWGAQFEAIPGNPGLVANALGVGATDYIATTSAAVNKTDFTIGTLGAVSLTTAPASGTCLAWSGNYYRRVTFAEESLDTERVLNGIYEAKAVELVSVKP